MVFTVVAKDLMSDNFKSVQCSESLRKAAGRINNETEVLFVFDNDDFLGSITEKMLVRSDLERILPSWGN